MARPAKHTPAEKAEAVALSAKVGPSEAGRRLGIPGGTIASWAHRAGVVANPEAIAKTAAAVERRSLTVAQRKAELAERMLGEAERILGQLHEPHVEKVVKTVSQGGNLGANVEIVQVRYNRPPTGDQQRIVATVATLVDKVQLLTGDATVRTERLESEGRPTRRELEETVARLAGAPGLHSVA